MMNHFLPSEQLKQILHPGTKLDLSKTVYKNLSSGQLVFAVDSTSSPTDEFSCTHRFNIGEINSFARSAGKKKIDFYSDLIPEYNCITTVVFRAEGREAELVGDYTLQNGDTTYSIKLHQNLYRYSATFSPMSDRFTNLENGSWNFNSEENILRIHTENRLHSAMGIMIVLRKTRAFKVIKTGNRLEFESFDGSTLTKMN